MGLLLFGNFVPDRWAKIDQRPGRSGYSVCKSLHALTLGTDISQSSALVPLQQVRRENSLLTTGCAQLVGRDLCKHFRCVPEELSWNGPGTWGGPPDQSLKRRRGLPVWENGGQGGKWKTG